MNGQETKGPSADTSEERPLFLIDGNNVAYRAFFALPEGIATSTGFPTNALYGFTSMIIKILGEYRPRAVIVAWDSKEKTFRHDEFDDYKAQRKPMPGSLAEQWPVFPEITSAFGFVNVSLPGYEADDILATLAKEAEAKGQDAVIVTGDKDALQLVSDRIHVMSTTRGVSDVRLYDPAGVEERFGVSPRSIPDLIGLKGDTSDNIPGVPGIGEKTAAQLIQEFGSLEGVLEGLGRVKGDKRRELLRENADLARFSKKLAILDSDAPLEVDALAICGKPADRAALQDLLTRLEFTSLLPRVAALEGAPPAGTELAGTPASSSGAGSDDRLSAGNGGATASVTEAARGRPLGDLLMEGSPVAVAMAGSGAGVALAQETELGAELSLVVVRSDAAEGTELGSLLAVHPPMCHDFKRLECLRDLIDRPAHDTHIAAYLLNPGRRSYGLDEVAAEEGVVSPDMRTVEAPWGPALREAASVLRLARKQETKLRAQGMWELFQDIELPLTGVLVAMEEAGIHLDCYRLGEIAAKMKDQLEGLETCIFEAAGEEFNLGSPAQLGRILFEKLGLERQRKTKTGYSTDAKALEALRDAHPVVEMLLSHRELSKLMSTYLLALPEAVDPRTGRLHTTFHQTVTATGRLSSSDPNLQNIPVRTALGAQIRQCFTAEPGNLLVVADYSQIELRIMAHLSQDATLLDSFARGEDIHARTAAEVFGLPEGEVDTVHRRYAKAVNFGIMYGISPFGLSQQLGVEREAAGEYIERYFERMPGVASFIASTIAQARRDGYVATMFGRRRPIPELRSDNHQTRQLGERLAVNSVIQGSAADIIKVAMIRSHTRLGASFCGAKLVLQVHDELLFEVPEDSAAAVRGAVIEEMVAASPMTPPLEVEAGAGADWLAAK